MFLAALTSGILAEHRSFARNKPLLVDFGAGPDYPVGQIGQRRGKLQIIACTGASLLYGVDKKRVGQTYIVCEIVYRHTLPFDNRLQSDPFVVWG